MRNISLDNLDMLSLNILVNLYEHHSATFVSQQMNIPAPKISRCLQHARIIFNNPLFIRKKHGLIPNDFARQLYPIAKEIVQCSEHLRQLNNTDAIISKPYFTIHASDLIVHHLPQLLMNAITEKHQALKFKLSSDSTNVLTDIIENRIDVGLISQPHNELLSQFDASLEVIALKRLTHLYLVCDLQHPLLKQEISLESIAQYPYVSILGTAEQPTLDPYLLFCSQHQLPYQLHQGEFLNDAISLDGLCNTIVNTQAISLLPYSKIYDHSNQMPNLHVCRLSEIETERLYLSIPCPTLYLVTKKGHSSNNIAWLTETISHIVNRSVH